MTTPITPDLVLEFRRYNHAQARARREYARHPFADEGHGYECARQGCPDGFLWRENRRRNERDRRRRQRAQRSQS